MSDTPEFDWDAAEKIAREWKTTYGEDHPYPLILAAIFKERQRLVDLERILGKMVMLVLYGLTNKKGRARIRRKSPDAATEIPRPV